jgi:RNA polymerase sigma factor (sigma-70 family)
MEEAVTIPTTADSGKLNIPGIIKDYSNRLFGFIRKRVNTEADAEDVLQDVFFQLVGNTKPINQISAWLFTVARNKITDRQRKKQYDLLEDELITDEELGWQDLFMDEADGPEAELLKSMFWDELYSALNELPEAQKKVFILHELEGVPFTIIA